MIQATPNTSSRHSTVLWRWTVSVITVLVMTLGNFASISVTTIAQAQPLAASVSTFHLSVMSANDSDSVDFPSTKGEAITQFK